MESQLMIKVDQLSKKYKLYDNTVDRLKESIHPFGKKYHKEFYALKNISFDLKKGEILGIVGKNGSGKSTLLKIITGVLAPTSGLVKVNGRISALLELGAGFNPELTGIENVYLSGNIMGYTKKEIDAKLDEIISFADIGEFIHQPVKMYSSGMFARLAFAVSCNVDPEVLIVDEALSVGDMFFQAKCMTRMRRMMEKGTTVLFVTHDTNTVKSFCQKAIWLQNGEIIEYGDADTVVSSYEKALTEGINDNNRIGNAISINNVVNATIDKKDYIGNDVFDNPQYFRRGIGLAKFRKIEVLKLNGEILNNKAEFNQEVKINAYIEILESCENLSVVYRIRNKQGIGILGNDTYLTTDMYKRQWKQGQIICVSFVTKLPIEHGVYNIAFMISSIGDMRTFSDVLFSDWIENAYVFEMSIRKPIPVWQAVLLENDIEYKIY